MVIAPGKSAEVEVKLNPLGKSGSVLEEIAVISDDRSQPVLKVHVIAQVRHDPGRLSGEQFQKAIFSDRCATCHGVSAAGSKSGAGLYGSVCAMCHKGPEQLKTRAAAGIRRWTAIGNPSNGMPGYERAAGGPLTDIQIESLVNLIAAAH